MKMFIARHNGVYLGGLSIVFAESEERATHIVYEKLVAQGLVKRGEDGQIDLQRIIRPKTETVMLLEDGNY